MGTIAQVLAARLGRAVDSLHDATAGPLAVEVRVSWAPSWHPLSYIPTAQLKAQARQMEASKYPPQAAPDPDTDRATAVEVEPPFSPRLHIHARGPVTHLQRYTRGWLQRRPLTHSAPSAHPHPQGPFAVQIRDHRPFFWLVCPDNRRRWVAWDALTTPERRRCRSLLATLGLQQPEYLALLTVGSKPLNDEGYTNSRC